MDTQSSDESYGPSQKNMHMCTLPEKFIYTICKLQVQTAILVRTASLGCGTTSGNIREMLRGKLESSQLPLKSYHCKSRLSHRNIQSALPFTDYYTVSSGLQSRSLLSNQSAFSPCSYPTSPSFKGSVTGSAPQ